MNNAAGSMRDKMKDLVHGVQDRITAALSDVDGTAFREDSWEREGGGGGRSRVIENGGVFEKAGVNVSVVHGTLSLEAARAMGGGKSLPEDADLSFWATGISLVLHPKNPMAPTVHANYRYFERGDGSEPGAWWFGGGADLTPAVLFGEDARHFHQVHKDACHRHHPSYYPRFKAWCDDYFFIKHRGESRGIGGIFFDDLHEGEPEALFSFVEDCANAFLPAYLPILERRKDLPYTDADRQWQQLRRGRYVEFNLVYDRGTVFGLKTGGRIESILMSLPLTARWQYNHHPEPGTDQAELLHVLKNPRDWIPL
jgi:coproporphyrinogen III oxidase